MNIEALAVLLKMGAEAGTDGVSFDIGKPKLKEDRFGMPVPLFSIDPKIFCSNSCTCWYTAEIHQNRNKLDQCV